MKKKLWIIISILLAVGLCVCLVSKLHGRAEQQNPEQTTASTAAPEQTTQPTSAPTTMPPAETTAPTETTVPAETTLPPETTEPPTEPETEPPTEPETEPEETDDGITWTSAEGTVYATQGVNVRSGPGTDYEKLGKLSQGDSVKRTHIGSNGWSKVVYNGKTAYISSNYLSTTKPSSSGTGSGNTPSSGSAGSAGGASSGSTGTSSNSGEIIYTYTDGTTGTEPKEGATFEVMPGVIVTVHDYSSSATDEEREAADEGVYYCSHCGKVMGDGSGGTCIRWSLVAGEHSCPCCGATVPEYTCHSCSED